MRPDPVLFVSCAFLLAAAPSCGPDRSREQVVQREAARAEIARLKQDVRDEVERIRARDLSSLRKVEFDFDFDEVINWTAWIEPETGSYVLLKVVEETDEGMNSWTVFFSEGALLYAECSNREVKAYREYYRYETAFLAEWDCDGNGILDTEQTYNLASSPPRREWSQAASGAITAATQEDEAFTRKCAESTASLLDGAKAFFGMEAAASVPPLSIRVFHDRQGMDAFCRKELGTESSAAGLYVAEKGAILSYFRWNELEIEDLLAHEATHHFNRSVLRVPHVWLDEGLALWAEANHVEGRITPRGEGAVARRYLESLDRAIRSGRCLSVSRLLELSEGEFYALPAASVHYPLAWAVLHFLGTDGAETFPRRVREYLALFPPEEGADPSAPTPNSPGRRQAAFRKAFGRSPEEVDREVRRVCERASKTR